MVARTIKAKNLRAITNCISDKIVQTVENIINEHYDYKKPT